MVIYGFVETAMGIKEVCDYSDFINKIKESTSITESIKNMVLSYFESKRTHAFISKCIGGSMLAAGQTLMAASGLAGLPALISSFPGATLTILGIATSIICNADESRKFKISKSISEEEKDILTDNTLKEENKKPQESDFHALIRKKCGLLENLSKRQLEALVKIIIYNEITKYCIAYNKPIDEKNFTLLLNAVINKSLNTFSEGSYFSNIREAIKSYLSDQANKEEVLSSIKLFYDNKICFYNKILELSFPNISKPKKDTYTDTSDLIKTLKENKLWNEVCRKLLKRLIINKKSNSNIRGNHFNDYIETINTKCYRSINLPRIIPAPIASLFNKLFPRLSAFLSSCCDKFAHLLPLKSKTIYIFNENKFLNDLKNLNMLTKEKQAVLNEVLNTLLIEKKYAVSSVVLKQGQYKLKSDVFRPLWVEIPNLIQQEQLASNYKLDKEKISILNNDDNNKILHKSTLNQVGISNFAYYNKLSENILNQQEKTLNNYSSQPVVMVR